MTASIVSSLQIGSTGVGLEPQSTGPNLAVGNWPGIWHLSRSNALVPGDMLGPKCIGGNLMLGPTEGGIVLESVVKSGTHFILLPHGKGTFCGAGLPRSGREVIWIM